MQKKMMNVLNVVVMLLINSKIRTKCADELQRTISLKSMQNCLMDLFCDRTKIETSLRRFFDEDNIKNTPRWYNCLSMNDERTIKFHQGFKQQNYVFNEDKQIWIDPFVDPIEHDYFIPRDDAND